MSTPNIGSPLTALLRLALYAGFTLPLMPVQLLAVRLNWRLKSRLPHWYHRCCCGILGISIERRGRKSRAQPTLYVVNHTSYLDIMVLSALIEGSFVAKAEVSAWPFFGWLAKLQRTVFVERRAQKSVQDRSEIAVRLQQGDNLILFAEGTSSDGIRVLPFKSALFSVADQEIGGSPLQVQPVSVTYTRLDGVPIGRYLRPLFAWYGDMELAGHLWRAMGMGMITVVVEFHSAVTLAEFGSRKALCAHCEACIAEGVSRALAGRSRPPGRAKALTQPA